MTPSYEHRHWDFSTLFSASSCVLTQVSVSFLKLLLWWKKVGRQKERSGKGQGSLITPLHFKHFPPSHALPLSEWTNPACMSGENFVSPRQGWKRLHEGIFLIFSTHLSPASESKIWKPAKLELKQKLNESNLVRDELCAEAAKLWVHLRDRWQKKTTFSRTFSFQAHSSFRSSLWTKWWEYSCWGRAVVSYYKKAINTNVSGWKWCLLWGCM